MHREAQEAGLELLEQQWRDGLSAAGVCLAALESQWQLHGLARGSSVVCDRLMTCQGYRETGAPVQQRAQSLLPAQPVPLGALKHKGALTTLTGTVPC